MELDESIDDILGRTVKNGQDQTTLNSMIYNAMQENLYVEIVSVEPGMLQPISILNSQFIDFSSATINEKITPERSLGLSKTVMLTTFFGTMTLLGFMVAIRRR